MVEPKADNVVEKIDIAELGAHQSALDAAYRGLQRVYKALTYEVGRLESEPGLQALGGEPLAKLTRLAERVQELGQDLRNLAWEERGEQPDGPQAP